MKPSIDLGYTIPQGFLGLPALDDPEVLADELQPRIAQISTAAGVEAQKLRDLYGTVFGSLIAAGAVYIGFGYFRADDGSVSTATLNVFVKGSPETKAHIAAAQILAAHSEGGSAHTPGMSATAVELPCGPAVFVMRMTLPPSDVGEAPPAAWQAQAVIPMPGAQRVVVIDLSTASVTDAAYYAGVLDGIARTVTFGTPTPPRQQTSEGSSPVLSNITGVLG